MIDREEVVNGLKLRENVRNIILLQKENAVKEVVSFVNEKFEFREILRSLMMEAATEKVKSDPHPNTGINVLEDLLKKIIPVLEVDFKSLTTDEAQRLSFRAHVLNAIQNTLAPIKTSEEAPEEELQEADVEIDITDDEKFIDIEDKKEEPEEEEDPVDAFGIDGEDETGRNAAYSSFQKIEQQIIDAYAMLGNDEDKEVFYDYLLTNIKLYFDKFDEELQSSLSEPESPGYEKGAEDELGGEELDMGDEEELAL